MMISINIFNNIKDSGENEELSVFSTKETKNINNYEEDLETYMLINEESPTGYRNIQIINDEVYSQTVRVKGETVTEVIKREMFRAYVKEKKKRPNGIAHLMTLCKKEDMNKVVSILEKHFDYEYVQHQFDILKIINAATDVRNARFNVKIETVSSVSIKGTRVHDTNYYAQMLRSGQLTGVIISYDMPNQTVTFRINVDGSIFLFNQLNDYEIIDLIEDLLNII